MLKFEVGMTKIKENKSFYLIGLFAVVLYASGVFANSVYQKFGGLALGLVIALVAFFAEVYFIATAGAVAKARTKGTLLVSSVLALFYVGLFIASDIADKPITYVTLDFDVCYTELGITVKVFEMICLTLLLLTVGKYTANAFGKELSFYERILGTMKARQEHKEDAIDELPKKDTDRIILEAKADVQNITINDVNPVYPPEKEAESVISEHKPTTPEAVLVEPCEEEVSTIEVKEPIITNVSSTSEDDSDDVVEDSIPVDNIIKDEDDSLFSSTIVDEEPTSQTFARDVRQEYVIHRTTHKEDENDDLYTDFTYGSDDDK